MSPRPVVIAWIAALLCTFGAWPAVAAEPSRRLSQFHHTTWTAEDGAPLDLLALAQTEDGFLWIGGTSGLYRFDGVLFEKPQLSGDQMPSVAVNSLVAMPGGDLWIGYVHGGVARLRGGQLTDMSEGFLAGRQVMLTGDANGSVYAFTTGTGYPALARFADGKWQRMDADWGLPVPTARGTEVSAMVVARSGVLWVVIGDSLFYLRPGAKQFTATGQQINGVWLTEARDGTIWSSARWAGTASEWLAPLPRFDIDPLAKPVAGLFTRRSAQGIPMAIRSRDGSLWSSTAGGLIRLESGVAGGHWEEFTSRDGLTADTAGPIIEDREGNIWVGTNLGLERFRATPFVVAEGVPQLSSSVWAAPDLEGNVYIASHDRLYRAHARGPAQVIAERNQRSAFVYTDREGVLWLGGEDRLRRVRGGALQDVPLPEEASGDPVYISESRTGDIWLSIWANGVFRQESSTWRKVDVPSDPLRPAPDQLFHDADDNVWMIFRGVLSRFEKGTLREITAADGLLIGRVQTLARGAHGLLAAGDLGIARFDGQRFQSLLATRFPDLGGATGIVQTSRGDTWINTVNGVVVTRTSDLDRAFDDPDAPLPHSVLGLADGLPGIAQQDANTPSAMEAADGTLWFVTNYGVAWIDPASVVRNSVPPPVSIRSLSVSGRSYEARAGLALPPGSRDVQIDYTALSLSAPERVRFRYRLVGTDEEWIDPGVRRQAFYTNLGPGPYVFEVTAANNDGVWNDVGARLEFRIAPKFFQTWWFYALCGVVALAMLRSVYLFRLRHLAARMREQAEVRLTERDRIARELHDTLLQGFQALVLKFQAIAEGMPAAAPSRRSMEDALDKAVKAIIDGRERIVDLRTTERARDLSDSIAEVMLQLDAGPGIQVNQVEEGKARTVNLLASTEIREIVREAFWNASRHANCRTFEVRVIYLPMELRLILRDDGVGIPREILDNGGKPGHYGLTGMRERARALRGRLDIHSEPGAGCTISLFVPGYIAYRKFDLLRFQLPFPRFLARWMTRGPRDARAVKAPR